MALPQRLPCQRLVRSHRNVDESNEFLHAEGLLVQSRDMADERLAVLAGELARQARGLAP